MSVSNTLHEAPIRKVERIEPAEFFCEISVPGGVQGVVTGKPPKDDPEGDWTLNDHLWNKRLAEPGAWMANAVSGRRGMYMTMASFNSDAVTRWEGRKRVNVSRVGGYWIDIDVIEGHAAGDYDGADAVTRAVAEFIKKTGLVPNFIVKTGSGGVHLHFVLTEPVTPEQWEPGAKALVRLASDTGLLIDRKCTTDCARIMRAPGSIHQRTGKVVTTYRVRPERYELAVFQKLVGCEPGSLAPRARTGINGDVLGETGTATQADFVQIKAGCEAIRWAADPVNQPHVGEPYWRGLLGIVKFCAGAEELAHEVSRHHPSYDPEETDRKLEGWKVGPTTCEYFAGFNRDACAECKHAEGGEA